MEIDLRFWEKSAVGNQAQIEAEWEQWLNI